MSMEKILSASLLPAGWNSLAGSCFQRRTFLQHCEMYNPCHQRYYVLREHDELKAGAVLYTLQLNLLTFLNIKSPLTMQVVGIPCSVSSSGFIGDPAYHRDLMQALIREERGLMACLNLDTVPDQRGVAVGRTFPGILFENKYLSWNEYLSSLRAPYRRRMINVEKEAARYHICTHPCAEFTGEEYGMYLNVYERSSGKLEKLTAEFFRNLPASFHLTRFFEDGIERGWVITVLDHECYYFFLGGQEYSGKSESLYLVKLMTVLKQGIASGARLVDFGQTAEIPKMRLGGTLHEKILIGRHHKPLYTMLLQATIGILSYRKRFPEPRVFKGIVS